MEKRFEWKNSSFDRRARRVGKSTVAEEFARKEYESYILIDFSQASKETRSLFDDISDINYLFLQLQLQYKTDLHERKSVIIFDEVQFCPMARQAIKFLVQDYRYDYIETGSLISIRKNVKDILIPSEERKISMYPMDYEEFLWARDNKVRISELCIEHTDLKSDSRNNDKDHKFYTAMLDGLGGILSSAFKDNEFLEFAVITGCLRIAKESIFTSTNNFASYSVLDEDFSEYFGFSEDEVEEILIAADQKDKAALKKRKNAKPKNYWKYTSHNSVLLTFVERTDFDVAEKFETLLNGGTVTEWISDELTHDTLHASEDNLWSVLLMTGYITKTSPGEEGEAVCLRFLTGRSRLLWNTISCNDYHEDYYHAFLAGIFVGRGYHVESNKEKGLGRPDILLRDKRNRRAIIIEAKKSRRESDMEKDCEEATGQMIREQYAEGLYGYTQIFCYGISFFQKQAKVKEFCN